MYLFKDLEASYRLFQYKKSVGWKIKKLYSPWKVGTSFFVFLLNEPNDNESYIY